MYQFLCIFFIYAFLGWCLEVSFAALMSGKFVNRGFLNGPICPIYGSGVVIVLACLAPLRDNLFILFIASVLLTSALEWITGFVLEKIFHQRWWDYSDEPFNLSGYVCLRFSLAWGLACLFVTELFHPTVLFLINLVPQKLGWVLLGLFAAIMAVDLAATVRTITNMNRRLSQIDELAAKIKDASNEFGENLADKVLDAAEKGSDLKQSLDEHRDNLESNLSQRKADLQEDMDEFKENMDDWKDNFSRHKADFHEDMDEFKENMDGYLDRRKADLQEDLGELKDSLAQRRDAHQLQREEQKVAIRTALAEWQRNLQKALDADGFGQRRLLDAFPKMRSTKYNQALGQLRQHMSHHRKGKRK